MISEAWEKIKNQQSIKRQIVGVQFFPMRQKLLAGRKNLGTKIYRKGKTLLLERILGTSNPH
jgi:hypothetical protein